jgi:hypothetical protein
MHAFHFSNPRCTEEFFDYVRAHDGNRTWTFALMDALWTQYQVTSAVNKLDRKTRLLGKTLIARKLRACR